MTTKLYKHVHEAKSPGRPPLHSEPMQLVNVHMPAEMVAWLELEALKYGKSRSEIIRDLLDFAQIQQSRNSPIYR